MRINLDFFKKFLPTPVMRGCLDCKKIRPAFTLEKDVFNSQLQNRQNNFKDYFVKLFNPYTRMYCFSNLRLDLSKPWKFSLCKTNANLLRHEPLALKFHPDNVATVFRKVKDRSTGNIKRVPFKVRVLTSSDNEWTTTYHFMSNDLKKEVGYVSIGDYRLLEKNNKNEFLRTKFYDRPLLKNYKRQGVTGDRIKILYLQNSDDTVYSGIGLLADRLAVEYCLKNNLPLNIVSDADIGSHIAHYKRGKRFLPFTKGWYNSAAFFEKYNDLNPNRVIRNLLFSSVKNNEMIDLSGLGALPMYLPKKLAQKYAQLAKSSPIIHD